MLRLSGKLSFVFNKQDPGFNFAPEGQYMMGIPCQYIFVTPEEYAFVVRLEHKRITEYKNHHPIDTFLYLETPNKLIDQYNRLTDLLQKLYLIGWEEKYEWIEVNALSIENIYFLSYAIEKKLPMKVKHNHTNVNNGKANVGMLLGMAFCKSPKTFVYKGCRCIPTMPT